MPASEVRYFMQWKPRCVVWCRGRARACASGQRAFKRCVQLQAQPPPEPPHDVQLLNDLIREYFKFQHYTHSLSVFEAGASLMCGCAGVTVRGSPFVCAL